MATNIPPHNLGELVDVLCALIHNPEATVPLISYLFFFCVFVNILGPKFYMKISLLYK